MTNSELKSKIVAAGMTKIKNVINDFEERITELKAVTLTDQTAESASQTESRRDSDLEMLDNLYGQLEFARQEERTLQLIDPRSVKNFVDFGAVVLTDKRNLFVSTGIEEFEVDGIPYFGLSTKAPLYKNMAGFTVGEKVSFHGIEYLIKEIF
ncbi:MAG: hypothetical protein KDC83_08945 [Flavobacteriales bacterium]|nr:hypothetical protein [Flavobacteriales bacterium]